MKRHSLPLGLLLLLAVSAFAASPAGTSASSASSATSASSDSTSGDDKVVLDARDDAAGFVASEGRIRGVRLEAALIQLRARSEAARSASDMMLARAILAQ